MDNPIITRLGDTYTLTYGQQTYQISKPETSLVLFSRFITASSSINTITWLTNQASRSLIKIGTVFHSFEVRHGFNDVTWHGVESFDLTWNNSGQPANSVVYLNSKNQRAMLVLHNAQGQQTTSHYKMSLPQQVIIPSPIGTSTQTSSPKYEAIIIHRLPLMKLVNPYISMPVSKWSNGPHEITRTEMKNMRVKYNSGSIIRIREVINKTMRVVFQGNSNPYYISTDNLNRLFKLYDNMFFDGIIQNKLMVKEKYDLEMKVSGQPTSVGRECNGVRYSETRCKIIMNFNWSNIKNKFSSGQTIGSIKPESSLMALQLIMEQQIVSLLVDYIFELYDEENERFTKLWLKNIFGQTKISHSIYVPGRRESLTYQTARIGQSIEYQNDGTRIEGIIIDKAGPSTARILSVDGERYRARYESLVPIDKDLSHLSSIKIYDRYDFHVGQNVHYQDNRNIIKGVVTSVNGTVNAKVTGNDGRKWRIRYAALRPIGVAFTNTPTVHTPSVNNFKIGQSVTYVSRGTTIEALILDLSPQRASVLTTGGGRIRVPYSIMKPLDRDLSYLIEGKKIYTRNDVRLGNTITFKGRGQVLSGQAIKLNPKTAKVNVDGSPWTVYYRTMISVD